MVFSGIVESMGTVVSLVERDDLVQWDGSVARGVELTVADSLAVEGASEGCSIAVNGACLTVTRFDARSFVVGLAPETLRRTNLGELLPGARVNLERSLASGARNSGHLVQGHVDGTGIVAASWRERDSLWFRVVCDAGLLRYIVPKGYVAVDGTSLTVCEVDAAAGCFTFMLIAFTQGKVVVAQRRVGDRVNLEADVIGKLVERSAGPALASAAAHEARLEAALAALDSRVRALEAAATGTRASE